MLVCLLTDSDTCSPQQPEIAYGRLAATVAPHVIWCVASKPTSTQAQSCDGGTTATGPCAASRQCRHEPFHTARRTGSSSMPVSPMSSRRFAQDRHKNRGHFNAYLNTLSAVTRAACTRVAALSIAPFKISRERWLPAPISTISTCPSHSPFPTLRSSLRPLFEQRELYFLFHRIDAVH